MPFSPSSALTWPELMAGRAAVAVRSAMRERILAKAWTMASGLSTLKNSPRELIAAVLPDVLVKGADWAHWIAGREEVEAAGGKVLALALEPGYSTTGIVEDLLARQ